MHRPRVIQENDFVDLGMREWIAVDCMRLNKHIAPTNNYSNIGAGFIRGSRPKLDHVSNRTETSPILPGTLEAPWAQMNVQLARVGQKREEIIEELSMTVHSIHKWQWIRMNRLWPCIAFNSVWGNVNQHKSDGSAPVDRELLCQQRLKFLRNWVSDYDDSPSRRN